MNTKKKLESAEKKFYKAKNYSLSSSRNNKTRWKTVNEVLGNKNDNYPPIFDETKNTYTSDSQEKAQLFNDYFLSHNRLDLSNASLSQDELEDNKPLLSDIK